MSRLTPDTEAYWILDSTYNRYLNDSNWNDSPTQEEIDRHYEYVLEHFNDILESREMYISGNIISRITHTNLGKLSISSDYDTWLQSQSSLIASELVNILDLIGLGFWKTSKGLDSSAEDSMRWVNYLKKIMCLTHEDFVTMVRFYHPISLSPITELESKKRVMERCRIFKEDLMINTWHPLRVEKLLLAGYDIEDI